MYTFADRVKSLRAEYDERHPKTRMALIAYLADAGYIPDTDVDQYIDGIRNILTFVFEDAEGFYSFIEGLDEKTEVGEDFADDVIEDSIQQRRRDGGAYL